MTLEQLRIFVAVAERLNMTRAAEALHITQSGVSASIGALEQTYGTALFDRIGRRIELSAAGRVFLVEAQRVVEQMEAAERALSDLSNLRRGRVSICASHTIGNYWVPRALARFQDECPTLEIELSIENTAGVSRSVIDGRAEIGFVEGYLDECALRGFEIDGDRIAIVVRPDHPWAMRSVQPVELLEARWILRERGSGTRSEFISGLAKLGVQANRLQVGLELPTNESLKAAVLAGAGPGAVSTLVVEESLRTGELVAVPVPFPRRSFRVLRHHERKLSQAAAAFLHSLQRRPANQVAEKESRMVLGPSGSVRRTA